MDGDPKRNAPVGAGAVIPESTDAGAGAVRPGSTSADPVGRDSAGAARIREWAMLGEWLASPPPLLHKVDLDVLRERLVFMGRARGCLAAAEAHVVAAVARREGDAGAELIRTSDGDGVPAGVELIVLADYDQVHDEITDARLADGTRLTEAETLALACDARILPGIFNKHTANAVLGRSQRKIPPWLRKQLIARDGGCIGCGAHHVAGAGRDPSPR